MVEGLTAAQRRMLERITGGGVAGGQHQTFAALVGRGFVVPPRAPGEAPEVTPEGRAALVSGVSRRVRWVNGVMWAEVAQPDGSRSHWVSFGPDGEHRARQGASGWFVRVAGHGEVAVGPVTGLMSLLCAAVRVVSAYGGRWYGEVQNTPTVVTKRFR